MEKFRHVKKCRQIFPCDKPVGTLLCNFNLPKKRDGKNTIYLPISTSKKQIFQIFLGMSQKQRTEIPPF